jgi:hypothetical protein
LLRTDPQGYAACEQLARTRGYNPADLGMAEMMFIDGCLAGKFR